MFFFKFYLQISLFFSNGYIRDNHASKITTEVNYGG